MIILYAADTNPSILAKQDVVWVASAGIWLQRLADFFTLLCVFALLIQLVLSLQHKLSVFEKDEGVSDMLF